MPEALLVGSVNLPSAADVFATAAAELGTDVKRIPDGETGMRVTFVASVLPALRSAPQLVEGATHLEEFAAVESFSLPLFAIRDGVADAELELPLLGYTDWARESYATFSDLIAR